MGRGWVGIESVYPASVIDHVMKQANMEAQGPLNKESKVLRMSRVVHP